MKLGTLRTTQQPLNETTLKFWGDGELVVVSKDNKTYASAQAIAPTLQKALESWSRVHEPLERLYKDLNAGKAKEAQPVDEEKFHSPLPRSYQWADGSAFLHHVKLVRQARNATMPESFLTTPLMYQGGSDNFLAPREDIPQVDFSHGTDFEGEVGVITDFVPMGSTPQEAEQKIRLFVIINDVSLRGLIPDEIAAGFGFFHGKPSTAFAPFAVTADELGDAWKEGRIHLPLQVEYNGQFFGKANAGQMHFSFGELIAHAAKTRHLMPGTIIGSGTVSNEDPAVGSSCLAEKRMIEKINEGAFKTPFMKAGDTIRVEMHGPRGENIFGTIFQKVSAYIKK